MELMGEGIDKIEIANKYLGAASMKIHKGDTLSFYLGGIEPTEDVLKFNPQPWNFNCVVRDNLDNVFPNGARPFDYLKSLSLLEYQSAFKITLKNRMEFVGNGVLKKDITIDSATNSVTFSATASNI